jgi:hypothetical protein
MCTKFNQDTVQYFSSESQAFSKFINYNDALCHGDRNPYNMANDYTQFQGSSLYAHRYDHNYTPVSSIKN